MTEKISRSRREELESLPPGVTLMEWSYERQRYQNPRIRTLLGCITLIGGVLESNYAILHCSPDRLHDIWKRVRKVAGLMRETLRPLLAEASVIPSIEEEREVAEAGLDMLRWTVLDSLDAEVDQESSEDLIAVRKQLCVAIGQINGYLQDTFGRLMAADPRSLYESDYYLSNRFPRDIEEAEWLHSTVAGFHGYLLQVIQPLRAQRLERFVALAEEGAPTTPPPWHELIPRLAETMRDLVSKLKEILALRGIRFQEMEALDRYTEEIPSHVAVLTTLHEALLELGGAEESRPRRVLRRRMVEVLGELDAALVDLISFVPLWLASIEERRALLLRSS